MLRRSGTRLRQARVAPANRLLKLESHRGLSATVGFDLVLDGLTLVEGAQPSLLDGRDVDEYVLAAAARRLDETITLLWIEPLHSAGSHFSAVSVSTAYDRPCVTQAQRLRRLRPSALGRLPGSAQMPGQGHVLIPRWREIRKKGGVRPLFGGRAGLTAARGPTNRRSEAAPPRAKGPNP
jgi:hypothetical protein